ncbi:MAG TPA: translocation/assembly module TamB [Rhizobium sp.]|nr:translocation/assembly module TamB [Rhizobium sp.]
MQFLTRLTKWILRFAAYVVVTTIALLLAAILLGGFTSLGGRIASEWLAALLSSPDRAITISDPGALLSGELRIGTITVSDTKGTYAEIRGLAIDWSPSALLSGSFDAERISAAAVDINRRPVATEQKAPASESGFKLPVRVNIGALQLPKISLASDVAGRQVTFSLTGAVRADGQEIAANLNAQRADMPEARIAADLLFAPADDRLRVKAEIGEPKGGIIAGMLRLPGEPALNLTINGDGPLSDWKGELAADVDGRSTVSVVAAHRLLPESDRHVSLKGSGRFDAILPPAFRTLFSGRTEIDIAANIGQSGRVNIGTGKITTGNLLLSASGQLDPEGDNDLKVNLTSVSGPIDFGWASGENQIKAAITGMTMAVTGPAAAASLDMEAALQSLEAAQGELRGITVSAKSGAFDLASRTGTLNTTVSISASRLTDPTLDRALRAPMMIKAPVTISADTITFDGTTIESASIGGKLDGTYTLGGRTLSSRFQLFAVPDALPAVVAGKFTGTIGFSGDLTYAQPRNITLDNLTIASDTLDATGNLSLDAEDHLSLQLEGRLADIGRFLPNTSGRAGFSLSAAGPLNELSGQAVLNADKAMAAGRPIGNLVVELDGTADRQAPQATVKVSGSLDGQPISGNGELVSANGNTRIPALSIEVGPNHVTGSMSISPEFVPAGELSFNFPDIGLLVALGGQRAGGDLKGKLTLNDRGGRMAADIVASGAALTRDKIVVTAPDIRLSVTDIFAFAAEGTIRAQSVAVGSNRLEMPVLAFARAGPRTQFTLDARYDGAPLATEGNIAETTEGLGIALRSLSASPRGIALKLAEPATILIAGGKAVIQSATIAADGGTITINGSASDTLDLTADLKNLPAALAGAFAPGLSPEGMISGKVIVAGTPSAPMASYTLGWSNAAVAPTRSAGLNELNVSAEGKFANDSLTIDTRTTGADGAGLTGGGSLALSGEKAIAMSFRGNLPFGILSGLLSRQGLLIEGAASVDIAVSGTLGKPSISGRLDTQGARLVDVRRNRAIEDLAASLALDGNQAKVTRLTGKFAGGGTISGSGSIDILTAGMPADITIKLSDAVYVDGTLFHTTASGTLALRGPLLTAPVLSGAIELTKTSITVPEKLPTSLAELNIRHKNAPGDVRAQAAKLTRTESHGSMSTIALDLDVSSPSRVYVRGRGIDAELGGALTIRGTSANPDVSGAFTMRRGRLTILTKRMEFTSGTITFGGGLIPLLDLVATTTSGSTTITVTLSGFADNPQVAFSSSPALPQDEILAQLIFGQSMSRLSALQIAQLADAASQLAGGKTSLFGTLRNAIGIDDLDITTDEKGQAQFSAGKYLNNRTYLELEQGVDGKGKAIINLDIGRGVKLKGQADGDGSGGAGIFYEKEY